jgi:hypothetical protein
MPTYNGDEFLQAALESVRQQQREGLELIIVDDGSTDGTLHLIRRFASVFPLRLLTPGRLGNWVAATNMGLREATGEWACFLHQDDLWLPGRLARLWAEMDSAPGSLIAHNARFIGPRGQHLGDWTCPFAGGTIAPGLFVERLLVQNFLAIPCPLFRRRALVESGGLNEALWFSADWDAWLRLAALGPVRFIAEALCAFRIHPASQTAARKLKPGEWEEQLTTVLAGHLKTWPATESDRISLKRVAQASVAVNAALSAASRGEPAHAAPALCKLLSLGPRGWQRYLRDSRIVERVGSRLRLQWQANRS